jgi:hypothetical protein
VHTCTLLWVDRAERYVLWRFGPLFCSEVLSTGQGSLMRKALTKLSVRVVQARIDKVCRPGLTPATVMGGEVASMYVTSCREEGAFSERGSLLLPSEGAASAKLRPVSYTTAITMIFGRFGLLTTTKAVPRRRSQPYPRFLQPYPRFLSSRKAK